VPASKLAFGNLEGGLSPACHPLRYLCSRLSYGRRFPAGGGIGTARDLARFYAMLAAGGTLDGVRILSAESVERATTVQVEVERDRSLGIPMRWALGFHLGGNRVDLFGYDTSPRAFGHGGHGSCVGWADPDVGLAVAIITNGLRSPASHALRVAALSAAIRKACL